MKISIGIPVFNCEKWVATAIHSALEQTWPDKEIIVVDDGSTDRTADICKSFGTRIIFVQQPHQGGNTARNQVCRLSSGDWIQFLDADDYLKPDKVRSQIAACSDLAKVDLLCSGTVYESWVNGSRAGEVTESLVENSDWFRLWLTWSMPQTGGCLWRKEALKEIGCWNEQLRFNQDYELYLRAFQKGLRFQAAGGPLSVYRIWSEDTVCRRDKRGLVLGKTELIRSFLQWLKSEGKWTPEYQCLAGRSCFEMARVLANVDHALAISYYRQRKREGLMEPEGAPLSPWKYRLALKCLGFSGAERLARSLRQAWKVF
jgi:glycosyltransferase involved in cell wall biosynthesis